MRGVDNGDLFVRMYHVRITNNNTTQEGKDLNVVVECAPTETNVAKMPQQNPQMAQYVKFSLSSADMRLNMRANKSIYIPTQRRQLQR